MRIVICTSYPVFAESMSFLLTTRGDDVVAVVSTLSEASLTVSHDDVDVCLVDVPRLDATDSADVLLMGIVKPSTAVVLLTDDLTAGATVAEAVGARAVADKRKPLEDIIRLIDSVHAGSSPSAPSESRVRFTPTRVHDNRRLASFLTPREREVLSALVRGEDTAKLARRLGISRTTVRCHVQSVLTKMGAHSRLEVATTAVRTGVVSPRTGEWLGSFDR